MGSKCKNQFTIICDLGRAGYQQFSNVFILMTIIDNMMINLLVFTYFRKYLVMKNKVRRIGIFELKGLIPLTK